MIYIGYLIYAAVIAAICGIPSVTEMILTSYNLATEITAACGVLALYPPALLFYYQVRKFNDEAHEDTFNAVVTMCSGTVVSLGLIGTFIGLTQMIEKIAGAIGGGGGQSMEEQIAGVMAAISASLNSMSFAFLTSVMGVSAAVVIAGACTYFREFFKDGAKSSSGEESVGIDETALVRLESDNSKIKSVINRIVGSNIDRSELSSIVISNSLQVKELTKITARLADQCEIRAQVEKELTDVLIRVEDKLSDIGQAVLSGNETRESLTGAVLSMRDISSDVNDSVTSMRQYQNKISGLLKQL
ncbi:hypothetical protein [Photobacterium kishitanii]|uniref:MotA/TolQ/ExbB proton channel domain-containing protein n=1 Tax=Photobacterium kishitanii TaxID=318456 RepID=A0A2T3KM58_9GAMM|nr:hypothetical protein [Photobacterium kishitanii]PSV00883.1 hypothetical protein C9J27_02320 [Photobacterium kishitanii]